MSLEHDANDYNWAPLDSLKSRLFRENGMTKVMVCQVTIGEPVQTHPLMNTEHARKYLKDNFLTETPMKRSTYLVIFGQITSQSPLSISHECFNLMLNRMGAFPAVLQNITSFAGGVVPSHESRGAFESMTSVTPTGQKISELCAIFKYVALNGRRGDPMPWSVRKTMVYQKYDSSNMREVVLLVRASGDMLSLTQEKMTKGNDGVWGGHHWTYILMLICSVLNVNWVDYLDHIEKRVWTLANSTTFTNPFNTDSGELDVDLEQGHQFDALKAGNYWEGLLTRASYALQSNIGVLKAMSTEVSRRRAVDDSPSNEQDFQGLVDMISRVERESQFLTTQIDSIRARLSVSLTMIRDCINARAAHHTAMEATYMHEVSARSLREAKAVRVIAMVTLIYLPGTFTATLGCNLFKQRPTTEY